MADQATWQFDGPVWRWEAFKDGPWHFVTVPPEISDDIDELVGARKGGFGSVRVEVRCGTTTWRTSVFPSTAEQGFVLPVKRAVREAEGLSAGTTATFAVTVVQASSDGIPNSG